MLISKSVNEIAELVGGHIKGNYEGILTGVAGLKEAMATDVAFLGNEKYIPQVLPSKAGVVLVPTDYDVEPPEGRAWIVCKDPSDEFSKVVKVFTPEPVHYEQGISPKAVVLEGANVAKSASVGPCAVISKGAVIGENTIICAGVFIGENVHVGEDCLIYPNVVIRERCIIGDRVILHPGVVIGADGFGYEAGFFGYTKVPQVGIVQLDDDVEVGANSTIDRARFGRTWIQRGTKIDNLVQIGHNVQVGVNGMIVAQVGIAGSATLGNNVILNGQSAVAGHLTVADGTMLMARSGVIKDTEPGQVLFGLPAIERREWARRDLYVSRLKELFDTVKALKKEVAELKAKNAEGES